LEKAKVSKDRAEDTLALSEDHWGGENLDHPQKERDGARKMKTSSNLWPQGGATDLQVVMSNQFC